MCKICKKIELLREIREYHNYVQIERFAMTLNKLPHFTGECCVCMCKHKLLTRCGHSVCNKCHNRIKTNVCPMCRQDMFQMPDRIAKIRIYKNRRGVYRCEGWNYV